jgi:hypothetical protein
MKMKRSLVLTFAILFLITNSVLVSAITGSMGNARMILYPEVNGWTNTVIEKTILVNNVNNVSINVTLEPDTNATKFINVIDKTFILEPGENKTAQFEVKVRKVGTYQGQINVFFRAENATEGGVVLSSTIIVVARKNQGYTDNSTDTTDNGNTSGNGTHVGNPTEPGQGLSTPVIVFGISTIVLIIILLLLLYIWNKKRSKSKKRKDKVK